MSIALHLLSHFCKYNRRLIDCAVWVNDYHLMLVPQMVRQRLPDAVIGFFLHIPFPSSEVFRCLHVRRQILEGVLGCDLLGFQTYTFVRHFIQTCSRILGYDSTPKSIVMDNTVVSVGIFPIGIDLAALNQHRYARYSILVLT
jgi:trehalose-6-phosphate synthase